MSSYIQETNDSIMDRRSSGSDETSTKPRHGKSKSGDFLTKGDNLVDWQSNGLRAVNTVAGAINNFFKRSSTPVKTHARSQSFSSLDRSNSHDSVTSLVKTASTEMDTRKNSIGLNRNPSYPKMHSRKNSSTDQSNSSGTHEHLRSKDSLPSISFSAADGVKLELDAQSVAASEKSDRSTDRKSFDGSESQKSGEPDPADLREKCFEKSLDTILDKCSETSMDLTLDSRDSKLTDESITSTKSTKSTERKKKSVPWYTVFGNNISTMLSPTYKSRSEDFKKQFKEIPTDERLIVDYSCALQKEILVHGRMFVTQNWICFYANIFRWETIVTIPTKEITAITKEKTARVIPNAIQVSNDKEKYFFTSFAARDKTYLMLFRIWQNALLEQPLSPSELWHWVHVSYGDELGLTSSDDDYVPPPGMEDMRDHLKTGSHSAKGDTSDVQVPSDTKSTKEDDYLLVDESNEESLSMDPVPVEAEAGDVPTDFSDTTEEEEDNDGEVVCSDHDHLPKLACNEVYQIPVDKLFELIFTDCPFFRHFTRARKLKDVSLTPWRDDPDESIGRVRDVTYTVPLNAPFGPKSSQTLEKQMCYKQSKQGILYVIDAECTPTGIPYADAFYVMNRYCLTRVSKEKSRLRVTSEVKYRKSVWGVVKNMIDRNSVQGVLDYFQCLGIHLRKESDKHENLTGTLTQNKRKLRKRRTHSTRNNISGSDIPTAARQMSRSKTTEKMIAPPTPVRSMISAQKEEKLLKMNADTLVRIVCFILVLLVMFNALLFYKLWYLENLTNVLYFPHSQQTIDRIIKHPPQSQDEWMNLLQQQQSLHETEMEKWKEVLSASIALVDQMRSSLSMLKDHIDVHQKNDSPS